MPPPPDPPDLATIRQHALAQRQLCRETAGPGYDPLVALWTAIHDAATALDPPLHKSITKRSPKWTQT